MGRKKIHEEFIEEMKKVNLDIKILGEYTGVRNKIECQCQECGHKWQGCPSTLLKKQGCPECKKIKIGLKNRKKHNDFVAEIYSINPNIIILTEYTTCSQNIQCKCNICGNIWDTTPTALKRNGGCPICIENNRAKKRTKTHDQFVQEMEIIDPTIIFLSNYTKSQDLINCKCQKCGLEWQSIANNLLRGHGCNNCKQQIGHLKQTKTLSFFAKEIKEINPDIIILGNYINDGTPIQCCCRKCNTLWSPKPNNLLQGTGCPTCKSSHGEKAIENWLKNNNIQYESQKKFEDLKDKACLPCDFYLPDNNIIIEYQGGQHEIAIDYFGGEEKFEVQQKHDQMKRNYCKENNIDFLEIWYYDYKNIDKILEERIIKGCM